ncbi:energy-coupling factor transporter ATPase [Enterocloster clostridioformis]|uniref:energy-coupling factor transporter ATPase n=1 Tax=Enterocloster clostridioformis TaxID=1531 RepID=UPI00080C5A21|nr:energy-coupling factor transporter ATPase [Enterocloster clostridioformis]ANU48126.1 energy-coupling factor transporter ATPase [Lachnoclostridium sp. YL32]NDO29582.1 energy-coupling factor transporter ATPase [Enterocloster clostridioformis]OXE69161.1 energy-coupling factor transporter ATPase [Enterocloster clostridioformis]QQR02982.1 energy-coupling factor transporter ATPase [Enterocloster clostridioformis]
MSIKAVDLNYVYGGGTAFEQHALFDVNLEIEDGEFVGLIGHTGSGKSTLIQHLNGLIKASAGELYYNGENIYSQGYDMKQLRSKVGLVFQYPEHQLFEVDVLTDVCFGPKNQGLSSEEAEARAKKALEQVGLDPFYYKQSPFELSGGQKRRGAIAGVLAMEPEVLILDEPTAGLDPRGRDEILDQIDRLHRERHMTIILVSHSMEDVARYADRLIVMNHGQKVFDGAPKEVFRHYRELETMGLAAPQITYLVHDLKAKGIDIDNDITTVPEAREAILALRNKLTESSRDKNV